MKLHTTLYHDDITRALSAAKGAGHVSTDVYFHQFVPSRSQSHPRGFLIQLGAFDQRSGPTKSRHYKNSGNGGGSDVWAASYDEWGWFIAEIFAHDANAKFGDYKGVDDFNAKTSYKYISE